MNYIVEPIYIGGEKDTKDAKRTTRVFLNNKIRKRPALNNIKRLVSISKGTGAKPTDFHWIDARWRVKRMLILFKPGLFRIYIYFKKLGVSFALTFFFILSVAHAYFQREKIVKIFHLHLKYLYMIRSDWINKRWELISLPGLHI